MSVGLMFFVQMSAGHICWPNVFWKNVG
jgi:hypothetical protein